MSKATKFSKPTDKRDRDRVLNKQQNTHTWKVVALEVKEHTYMK
jgi:hypothetical protein